eukprot:5742096-Lingulodinium_polyedra.AAC.1
MSELRAARRVSCVTRRVSCASAMCHEPRAVRHVSCALCRLPRAIYRVVYRMPDAVRRTPYT